MKWIQRDDYHLASDPAGFVINRAGIERIAYMAVRLGKPWAARPGETAPRGWDGSEILHVERDIDAADEPARRAAMERCKAACRV